MLFVYISVNIIALYLHSITEKNIDKALVEVNVRYRVRVSRGRLSNYWLSLIVFNMISCWEINTCAGQEIS